MSDQVEPANSYEVPSACVSAQVFMLPVTAP